MHAQEKGGEGSLKLGSNQSCHRDAILFPLLGWATEWTHKQGQEYLFLCFKDTLPTVWRELDKLLQSGSLWDLPASWELIEWRDKMKYSLKFGWERHLGEIGEFPTFPALSSQEYLLGRNPWAYQRSWSSFTTPAVVWDCGSISVSPVFATFFILKWSFSEWQLSSLGHIKYELKYSKQSSCCCVNELYLWLSGGRRVWMLSQLLSLHRAPLSSWSVSAFNA